MELANKLFSNAGLANNWLLQCTHGHAHQNQMQPADLRCWQITLTKLLHLGQLQTLATPLGDWIDMPQKHGWWFNRVSCSIWQKTYAKWSQHGQMYHLILP